jgi:4-hydroxy-tetrahydrodipicolinate reductase
MELPGSPLLGRDAGAFAGKTTGVAITADPAQGMAGADVLIDFTRPEGTLSHLALCRDLGVRAVIGTTGFTPAQKDAIAAHAQLLPTVFAANMSVGVNVVLRLLDQAARALGPGYDIEVVESHHRHKVDAPSGTALAMGEVLARATGADLDTQGVFTRHGHTGERVPGSIGFATVRGGDIVGDHLVLFAGTGERVEIAHKSSSRANYADGSLRAARFLMGLPAGRAGLYGMNDVLGLL